VKVRDQVAWSLAALVGHRLRSALSVLGIAIGIAAVILLTSIGEGARRYVFEEFTQFGTNLLSVNPGKTKTTGLPGILGGTTRKLTIEDALALRRVRDVVRVVPHTHGQARVQGAGRSRDVFVYGVTSEMPEAWKFEVRVGSFLPGTDPRRGSPVAVLGPTLARELFGEADAIGQRLRIGDSRFRVVGVLASKGQVLGVDLDDVAWIPLATHMQLFNLDEVQEITVEFAQGAPVARIEADVRRELMDRHAGEEDFTLTSQAAMLDVFGEVLGAVTLAVGAIGGVSLLVGAIGILTMMWIAVSERTGEIGILRAVGARAAQVQRLFLLESVALALVGGLAGVALGSGLAALLRAALPGLPIETPAVTVAAALGVSGLAGLASGAAPARRAAKLDPIECLRAE